MTDIPFPRHFFPKKEPGFNDLTQEKEEGEEGWVGPETAVPPKPGFVGGAKRGGGGGGRRLRKRSGGGTGLVRVQHRDTYLDTYI